jgi:hypothetical protein
MAIQTEGRRLAFHARLHHQLELVGWMVVTSEFQGTNSWRPNRTIRPKSGVAKISLPYSAWHIRCSKAVTCRVKHVSLSTNYVVFTFELNFAHTMQRAKSGLIKSEQSCWQEFLAFVQTQRYKTYLSCRARFCGQSAAPSRANSKWQYWISWFAKFLPSLQ